MEEGGLNFNAPLLSVRRSFTKPSPLDERAEKITRMSEAEIQRPLPVIHKTDESFDHLMEPASVPFVWEQVPGRPKDERHCPEDAGLTSSSPPPRVTDIVPYSLERDVGRGDLNLIRSERILSDGVNKKVGSWNVEEECDVYSEALDALSKTDSFSVNCSATDLSGLDGRGWGRSGTFSADQQARDFMMSRFLPAAKAMTLDQPQYSSKKQQLVSFVPDKSLQARKKAFSGEIIQSINDNRSVVVPAYQPDGDDNESEEDAEEVDDDPTNHDLDIPLKKVRKRCGLLSRLCIKNSLCILNPVPGLKLRTHSSNSSNRDHGRSIKTVKKHLMDSAVKHKSLVQSPRLSALHSKMSCRSSQVLNDSCEQLTPIRSSPYRRSATSSPYRSATSHSSFREAAFPGSPRDVEILRAYRLNKHVRGISRSQEFPLRKSMYSSGANSPVVMEKTLYVDTVDFLKPKSRVGSSLRNPAQTIGAKVADPLESPIREIKALLKGANKLDWEVDKERKSLDHGDLRRRVVDLDSSPRPPPLPKTPSESWLWRTLPSVASPNPYSHSRFCDRSITKRQDSKPLSASTKWETIVKTSYLHYDHVRYSEELVPYRKSRP